MIGDGIECDLKVLIDSNLFQINFRHAEIDFERVNAFEIGDILPIFNVVANAHLPQANDTRKRRLDFEFG